MPVASRKVGSRQDRKATKPLPMVACPALMAGSPATVLRRRRSPWLLRHEQPYMLHPDARNRPALRDDKARARRKAERCCSAYATGNSAARRRHRRHLGKVWPLRDFQTAHKAPWQGRVGRRKAHQVWHNRGDARHFAAGSIGLPMTSAHAPIMRCVIPTRLMRVTIARPPIRQWPAALPPFIFTMPALTFITTVPTSPDVPLVIDHTPSLRLAEIVQLGQLGLRSNVIR